MKIAFVCNEYPPGRHGGIGGCTRTLAEGLTELGHKVYIVGIGAGQAGKDIHGIDIQVRPGPAFGVRLRRTIRQQLGRLHHDQGLDLIECPDFQGLLPAQETRFCPTVIRIHTTQTLLADCTNEPLPRGIHRYETRTLQHAHWIAPSHAALAMTQTRFGIQALHHAVIPHPVPNQAPPATAPPTSRYWLFPSRTSDIKGARFAAYVANELFDQFPDHELYFAGEAPPDEQALVLEALHPDHHQRVKWLGHLDTEALHRCMQGAELAWFPSQLESFGLAAAECMSLGTPIIASDIPAFNELLPHTQGSRVPLEIDAWVKATATLTKDKELRLERGKTQQSHIHAKCGVEHILQQNLEFYQGMIRA